MAEGWPLFFQKVRFSGGEYKKITLLRQGGRLYSREKGGHPLVFRKRDDGEKLTFKPLNINFGKAFMVKTRA